MEKHSLCNIKGVGEAEYKIEARPSMQLWKMYAHELRHQGKRHACDQLFYTGVFFLETCPLIYCDVYFLTWLMLSSLQGELKASPTQASSIRPWEDRGSLQEPEAVRYPGLGGHGGLEGIMNRTELKQIFPGSFSPAPFCVQSLTPLLESVAFLAFSSSMIVHISVATLSATLRRIQTVFHLGSKDRSQPAFLKKSRNYSLHLFAKAK